MKKLLRIVALIGLLLVGSFLILRYVLFPIVPVDHLFDDIPADADLVILVDTKALIDLVATDIFLDPGSNPFDRSDEDDEDEDDFDLGDIIRKGLWHGIEIPEHLIIWLSEFGDGPQQFMLPLSDEQDFKSFMTENQERSIWYETEAGLWTDEINALSIQPDHLIVCLGRPEPNRDVNYTVKDWSLDIDSAMKNEEDVVRFILTRQNNPIGQGAVRSEKGKVSLSYESNDLLGFEARGVGQAPFSMAIQVDMDQLEASVLDKSEPHFLKKPLSNSSFIHLIRDRIWDGRFELCVQGLRSVEEEFITYTYNDDFEKIEHKEVKKVREADLWAEIGLAKQTDSLFYRKGWVKEVDGRDLFVKYPIQEVKFSENNDQVVLSSGVMDSTCNKESKEAGLFLVADIPFLENDWNQNTADSLAYSSGIERLEGRIDHVGKSLRFDVELTEKDQQGILSLIELMDR